MYAYEEFIDDSRITFIKSLNYSKGEKLKFIKKFEKYKMERIISIDSEFESEMWRICNGIEHRGLVFNFNEVGFIKQKNMQNLKFEYTDFIEAVKFFTILILDMYSIQTIDNFIRYLRHVVNVSHFFDIKNIKKLKVKHETNFVQFTSINIVLDFIDYFEKLNVSEEFYDLFDNILNLLGEKTYRLLPTFETMFKFAEIMDTFIKEADEEEIEKFFPVVLWWMLTSQLPLRTTELTLIPSNCIKKERERCTLLIRRTTIKGLKASNGKMSQNFNDNYRIEEVEINKKIYDLIKKYKEKVDKYDLIEDYYDKGVGPKIQREFLFSNRSYFKFLQKGNKETSKKKYYLEYLGTSVLRSLTNSFFIHIVSNRYGFKVIDKIRKLEGQRALDIKDFDSKLKYRILEQNEIEKIQNLDTRHFAIMNMIMQDVPPNAIKLLSGHSRIDTTYSYAKHLDEYIESYTFYLAKKKVKLGTDCNVLNMSLRDYSIERNLYLLEKIEAGEIINERIIDGNFGIDGYCIYKYCDTIPCKRVDFRCNESCRYYVPINVDVNFDDMQITQNNKQILSLIKTIEELLKIRKKIKDFDKRYRVQLNKIRVCVNQNSEIIKEYKIKITKF